MERIEDLAVSVFKIPTETPESDGTFAWDHTTLVAVQLKCGATTGLGYTYADTATARLIHDALKPVVVDSDAFSVAGPRDGMVKAVRNLGRPGIAAMAISAVDVALWDLKAKLLEVSLARLLGTVRPAVDIYGSGGFTAYSLQQLCDQLGGWTSQGIPRVKMKVGRSPEDDFERTRHARQCIGPDAELFVDANGAYSRKQALEFAYRYAELGVNWFEEPVPSDDLEGLRLLRDRAPPGMDITAGEYGYQLLDFQRMLAAGAVDCLQADATRCGGISGFLEAAAVCSDYQLPLSSHCAPSLHVAVCCAAKCVRHIEFFFDHVRIERMLFDGAIPPQSGQLQPDCSRPGLGLELKWADARRYQVHEW